MVDDVGRVPTGQALVADATGAASVSAHAGDGPSRDQCEQLRQVLLASVGGWESFKGGFNWRTFSPEKRARAAIEDAVNVLEGAMAELAEGGVEPDTQRAWLSTAVKKWAAWQHAGARTMNWMITGPARFPVARNEKAMRVEHARGEEFYQYTSGAHDWARRLARKAERREIVEADAASGVEHAEQSFGGVRVVLNTALNRVQILFPDKPSDDERRVLKSRAFRWAPSVGAWQRQLTRNGVWAAKAAMQDLGLTRDSDEHRNGEDAQRLSGEAMPARAEGIAQGHSA